jgi:hypothetical protein
VRLLADAQRSPVRPEECLIAGALAGNEPRTVDELVAGISRLLYREEWRRGGWAVDLGIFGSDLFAADVTHALEAGNGHLWTITESPKTGHARAGAH